MVNIKWLIIVLVKAIYNRGDHPQLSHYICHILEMLAEVLPSKKSTFPELHKGSE